MDIPLSLDRKPVPLTLTSAPGDAVVWSRITVGVTSKLVVTAPPDPPEAVMVLEPPEVCGICKLPLIAPSSLAVMDGSDMPSMVRLTAALGPKPVPRTCTLVPEGPLEGDTWKLDEMVKLPTEIPATLIGYRPAGSAGTRKVVENEPELSAAAVATCWPAKVILMD
jgi:hypothetical protein